MKVSLHSLDKDGIQFLKSVGKEQAGSEEKTPQGHSKTFGWLGEMTEDELWALAELAFQNDLAVKIFRSESSDADVTMMFDSNKWRFKQH